MVKLRFLIWICLSALPAALLLLTAPAFASHTCTTCYIDYVSGSDSNTGASTAAPWKHIPGMFGATGNANSQVPVAGDSYYLKGGVTWPGAALGIGWIWSGNATTSSPGCSGSGCIYLGVLNSWFAPITGMVNTSGTTVTWVSGVRSGGDLGYLSPGETITIGGTAYTVATVVSATSLTLTSSPGSQTGVAFSYSYWTRPIFNGGGTTVNTQANGQADTFLRLYANYMVIDNIEFTGLYWSGVPSYGTGANIAIAGGSPGVGTNLEIKNVYLHGWSHGTFASGTSENPCGVLGDTGIPNNNANTILHDSVIDGTDTDQQSCSAIFGSPPYVQHNYISYASSGIIANGTIQVDGNTIQHVPASFDPQAHTNGIEINGTQSIAISNNEIAHLGPGTLGIWTACDATYTCAIFNNLVWDTDTGNIIDLAAPGVNNGCANNGTYCNQGGTDLVFNNTVECGPNSNPAGICLGGINAAVSAVTIANNHFISSAATYWQTNGPTPTLETNLLQTLAGATGQGYTSLETYPFSPTLVGNSTVQAGTNLSGDCSGALATLCDDSPLGVTYNPLTHTVTEPFRAPGPRPPAGVWDIGAYFFVATPLGPSNVIATPH